MAAVAQKRDLVLAVHPWSRGFGWVVFESPLVPVDWGIAIAKTDKNARCMARLERLLAQYEPAVLVLETFEGRGASRAIRIKHLCRNLMHLASHHGAEVCVYSRAAIRLCFKSIGAVTRYEIVQAVVQRVDVFRHRLPRPRKGWMSEDGRLSLFEAAALAMTHFAITGKP